MSINLNKEELEIIEEAISNINNDIYDQIESISECHEPSWDCNDIHNWEGLVSELETIKKIIFKEN